MVDLTNEGLTMIINILLAQAYFCMYNKIDKQISNKGNLVKLANTIANYYNLAYELMSRDPLRRSFSKEYVESINSRELAFRAAAHLWQSYSECQAGTQTGRGYGIGLARLRVSKQLI